MTLYLRCLKSSLYGFRQVSDPPVVTLTEAEPSLEEGEWSLRLLLGVLPCLYSAENLRRCAMPPILAHYGP